MRRQPNAYTIIELLVAVAVTLLLTFLINRLFFDTVAAVGRGTALSDIISGARAVGKQIREDGESMVAASAGGPTTKGGPGSETDPDAGIGDGGILVIINRRIGDWNNDGILDGDANNNGVLEPELGEVEDSDPEGVAFTRADGTEARRFIRSDQLMFIRTVKPAADSSVTRILSSKPICPSTEGDFTSTTVPDTVHYTRVWYGHVRLTDPDGTDPGMSASVDDKPLEDGALGRPGANRLGNKWALGRQSLFLDTSGAALPNIHIDGGWYNAGGGDMKGYSEPSASIKYLHMGLTDYAYYTLADVVTSPHAHGAIVGSKESDITGGAKSPNKRLWSDLSETAYEDRALRFYTFAAKRLRANPTPQGMTFQSWQMAQTHPIFLANVSDFIVEFATDLHKDDTRNGTPNKEIDFYSELGAGKVVRWYVHTPFENPKSDPNQPYTFGPITDPPTAFEYAPYVNDDPAAGGTDTFPHADGAFVWRHDDDIPGTTLNKWPYMIRVRYRLHDSNGKFEQYNEATGQRESGKWFESVIQVKRP